MQIGIGGMFAQNQRRQFYYATAEVNFPAKRPKWYNSITVATMSRTEHEPESQFYKYPSWSDSYYLEAGKKRESIHNYFYYGFGFNFGLYYNHRQQDVIRKTSYGPSFNPQIEAGMNLKNTVIMLGLSIYVNSGYCESIYLDPYDYKNGPGTGWDTFGEASLYVKVLIR